MLVATDRPPAAPTAAIDLFTEDELSRLMWLQATLVAERYLVPRDRPCQEHMACRRLAFGLWLHLTGRVSEGVEA